MNLAAFSLALAGSACAVSASVINFELGAPDVFDGTTALRDAYSGLGVLFSGPGPLDGGGVLDQGSAFGILARSGVDFLAFNADPDAVFMDGGHPTGPQTISFATPQTFIEIFASGANDDGSFRMDAFDAADTLIATSGAVDAPAALWTPLSVNAPGIRRIVLTELGGDGIYVCDDLTFIPAPGTTLLIAAGTLAARHRSRAK